MKSFKADLHIHTHLSPCGSLDMSPRAIVSKALSENLQIIGISDHNTTLQSVLVHKIAAQYGLYVLCGAEVTSREEVHCLCFFENNKSLSDFQEYLNMHLPFFQNNPDYFGYQVLVDENEDIIYQEEKLLINAINQSINEIELFVHSLNGIFIPAHIDKPKNSIYSQLGFFPLDIKVDAVEVSKRGINSNFRSTHQELSKFKIVTNSDAHNLDEIGSSFSTFQMTEISYEEIRSALTFENQRNVLVN